MHPLFTKLRFAHLLVVPELGMAGDFAAIGAQHDVVALALGHDGMGVLPKAKLVGAPLRARRPHQSPDKDPLVLGML